MLDGARRLEAILAHDVGVGERRQKPDIDGERCPARVRLCGQRADQVGFANVEDVGEAGRVLPGNPVTISGGSHGVAQCDCRGREHVVLLGPPETRRRGADNGGECMPGIFDIEITKHRGDGDAQVACTSLRRGGKRGTQQNDAEVRVDADRREGRHDGGLDARADARAGLRDRCGRGGGAGLELRSGHAVTVRESMHVARLGSVELVETRGFECGGDLRGPRLHPGTPWARRDASAWSNPDAITDAILTWVTVCSPDQAGMLLTSSTVG